jgi:hypothetical protein
VAKSKEHTPGKTHHLLRWDQLKVTLRYLRFAIGFVASISAKAASHSSFVMGSSFSMS